MRLFVALATPADVAARLAQACAPTLAANPGTRAIAPENYHVTLAFLGEANAERAGRVNEAVARVAADCRAMPLLLRRFAWFPSRRRPLVLAALLSPAPALLTLQDKLALALAELGFPREAGRFRPHLSVARIRRQTPATPPPAMRPLRYAADAVTVYRSRQTTAGVRYEPLAVAHLRPPEPSA